MSESTSNAAKVGRGTKIFNEIKKLVGFAESKPAPAGNQQDTGATGGGAPKFQASSIMSSVFQTAEQSELGFELLIDAHPSAAATLGAMIVQALGIKRDRGAMTVADAPMTDLLTSPLLVMSVIDKRPATQNSNRVADFASDNDIQGILSTLANMFGKDDKPNLEKAVTYDLMDLLQAPGVSALNTLDQMLKQMRITDDAGFVLLFTEAMLRRTDAALVFEYLSRKAMEESHAQ